MSIEAELKRIADVAETLMPLGQLLNEVLRAGISNQPVQVPSQTNLPCASPAGLPAVPSVSGVPTAPITPPVTAGSAMPVPAVPSVTAPAPALPTLPGLPAAPTKSAERQGFETNVLTLLQPLGADGPAKLASVSQMFGVARLGELPENQFANFLTTLQTSIAA